MLELDKSVYELMKIAGWGRWKLFFAIAIPATAVAAYMIADSGSVPNWSDPGQLCVMAAAALVAYGAVWLYVSRWVSKNESRPNADKSA